MLTFIISGLVIQCLLLIETHSSALQPKKVIVTTNAFLNKSKHFILYYYFSLNTYECLLDYQRQ